MKPFDYQRLETPEHLGHVEAGRFLGGGTNLIDLMKHQIETPDVLVDVTRAGMDRIEERGDAVLIGSQVSNTDLASHPLIRRDYPVLSSALLSGATQQLRNKATTGGNLLQRTRCQYFYDTARACNKREPGSGCDALDGLNRFHAILGASENCIAVHPSDMAVAMAALGAVVVTRKRDGTEGRIPVTELHRLPGDRPDLDHVLDEGELIVAVELPASPPRLQSYRKVRDRSSYAFAVVSAAIALDLEDGHMRNLRIALGGVAHKPWRATKAEAMLEGKMPEAALFMEALEQEMADAEGHGHNDFKKILAPRVVVAMLRELTGLGGN
ncbi:FAD binding domain-containing protein [Hoeflea alexandrii]|uniref:Xanthine dehydrogenase family protein subunit M n=1 Tax=Hoeflea alexandrii TaxID=288436 RepID=A0ABT1CQ08_9HYPH|nr:xanthine dehydrogenase family protein subunit M [Hoeflea alexandrii]MCO6408285.1 xanthine dehydrogenase family protein subunit M [Hoeflea alexandrii]MCY0153419.1 xanthine dehydrogenase family protein subunit M [Hoeflea alexandrii]